MRVSFQNNLQERSGIRFAFLNISDSGLRVDSIDGESQLHEAAGRLTRVVFRDVLGHLFQIRLINFVRSGFLRESNDSGHSGVNKRMLSVLERHLRSLISRTVAEPLYPEPS